MLFASMTFIGLFLPLLCVFHFFAKKEWQNFILLIASLLFYAWGEPTYLAIMLITIIINYFGALAIEKWQAHSKIILVLCILGDLSFLVYFKYFNFLAENLSLLFTQEFDFINVVMPIGISFYTFQAISYLVDVYRQQTKAQKNFYDLALYISFFPQLIAGPIVKYHDIDEQIVNREITIDKVDYGVRRFILGLAKKVIIANTMGSIADQVFALDPSQTEVITLWLGAICYSLQLYFDFSGYSDMAIGLASIFGFKLLENFNYPYISKSITEFWRRWHMSLSTWFREYLYIPLGGNRVDKWRVYVNLFIVFLCTGVWHGASWNFIIWGLWHGLFIILERLTSLHKVENVFISSFLLRIYTLFVALIGWVFFRAADFTSAIAYLKGMFGMFDGNKAYTFLALEGVNNMFYIIFALAIICSMPIFRTVFTEKSSKEIVNYFKYLFLMMLFLFSVGSIAASTYNPFIYFRF